MKATHWLLTLSAVIFGLLFSGCAPLVVGAAAGGAGGTVTAAKASEEQHHSGGVYAATVASNIVYFPAKVIFAGAGAVTTGLCYLVTLGDEESAVPIWDASVMGDYLLTPDMMEGREPVHFIGPRG